MIKTRPQKKTASQLIKELDDIFSIFVRVRDADACGTVTCFVTGERVWWKEADAAHYYPRQHMGTRWMETNVHATTQDTNRYDPHHQEKYKKAMNAKYSVKDRLVLEYASQSLCKLTAFELMEKIDEYKDKVAALRRSKGL